MDDYQDFSRFAPLQRVRQMKVWVIIILFGIVFGLYGITSYWSGLHPIVQEMIVVASDWDLKIFQLENIEQQIINEHSKGARSEELIDKKNNILKKIDELDNKLQGLYEECVRNSNCEIEQFRLRDQIEQFRLRDQDAFIDWFLSPAYASNADQGQYTTVNKNKKQVDKGLVLIIVFVIILVVYLLAIYKVFFSRNPRNMDVAIDLLKSITGFWIGIGTTALGTS